MPRNDKYGYTSYGFEITAPEGWKLLPEGVDIPQAHRECIEDYSTNKHWWCDPRRCHSTMTPMKAMVWGGVRAFAVLEKKDE